LDGQADSMKFKNIKQVKRKKAPPVRKPTKKKVGDSGKKQQFPNIYRLITEKLSFRLSWQPKLSKLAILVLASISFLLSLALVVGIVVFAVQVYQNTLQAVQINNQRQNLQSKVNFWQSIIDKYDGYKDAYFQKALLEYNLGQIDKAKADNAKALLLDPNFADAKKLEVVLDKIK
jgi:tetratricopeptide (TPR) repeat protein